MMALTGEDCFTLPMPPSVNSMYRSVSGRSIKSKAYRGWQASAGNWLNSQHPKKFTGPVAVSMIVYPPDKRRRDLDNMLKSLIDLLVSHQVIERDDLWIVRSLKIDAGPVRKGDGVVLCKIDHLELE